MKQIVMAARPQGEPKLTDFALEEKPVPELKEGQVLIKAQWLSLDPYMRGRMSDAESYAEPLQVGEVMTGETAGVVVASKSPNYQEGDVVCCYSGWSDWCVMDGSEENLYLYKFDPGPLPLSVYLGAAGMPGRTAYFGLLRKGRPQQGETLVVAAASGAVGSVVGQIAKMKGCRVVGVAGGPEKCRYVVEELGFDECLDHRAEDFEAQLAAACPDGIDIYFENVGGRVVKAVAPLLNKGARVPICGYIAHYNEEGEPQDTPFHVLGALPEQPEHDFFLVTDWMEEQVQATMELAGWIATGQLKYKECIAEGLEQAPEAFIGMLKGRNFGKQLVKVAEA